MQRSIEPALILKTTPPRLRKNAFVRRRLRELRERLADITLVLVEAPAGFGKTSTLAQWRGDWLREGQHVAWLALEAGDEWLAALWGMIGSLRESIGQDTFGRSISDSRSQPIPALLTALLAEIAGLSRKVVLIIDDADKPQNPDIRNAIAYLFNNAPANLQLVLGSRQSLELDTSELASHDALWKVGASDLRLDLNETIAFMTDRLGAGIDIDACARLHELTEGWIMGLQLATSIIERSSNIRAAIAALSANPDHLAKDLIQATIRSLPDGFEKFLLYCAHLDALHPELCAAVTHDDAAGNRLQHLLSRTPLVTASEGSDWIRLHALAREHFRESAQRLPKAEIQEIHCRAESWYAANNLPEQAARHAFLAGHTERWIKLIAGHLYDLLLQGQLGILNEWCERLPATAFDLAPKVRLSAAWSIALGESSLRVKQQIMPLIGSTGADPETGDEAQLIMASAELLQDNLQGAAQWIARLTPRFSPPAGESLPEHPLIVSVHGGILAYIAIHDGNTERARYHLLRARPDSAPLVYRAYGDFFFGISYLWEGRSRQAASILSAMHDQFEKTAGRRGVLTTMLATGLAAALWDLNECQEARSLLANRIDIIERCALPAAVALGFQTLSRLALLDGDETRALSLLEELSALGQSREILRFDVVSLTERIRIHAARHRPALCSAHLERLEHRLRESSVDSGRRMPMISLLAASARAYAAIADHDLERAERHLDEAIELAKRFNRGKELAQALAIKAWIGNRNVSALLDESLSLAESYGLIRVYSDTLPEVGKLVHSYLASQTQPPVAPTFRSAILDLEKRQDVTPGKTSTHCALHMVLTPKEYEVLSLLAQKLPNKRIAEALDVSSETVKWHLKNLFSKLDAGSREHVVHRARMMGLLPEHEWK